MRVVAVIAALVACMGCQGAVGPSQSGYLEVRTSRPAYMVGDTGHISIVNRSRRNLWPPAELLTCGTEVHKLSDGTWIIAGPLHSHCSLEVVFGHIAPGDSVTLWFRLDPGRIQLTPGLDHRIRIKTIDADTKDPIVGISNVFAVTAE